MARMVRGLRQYLIICHSCGTPQTTEEYSNLDIWITFMEEVWEDSAHSHTACGERALDYGVVRLEETVSHVVRLEEINGADGLGDHPREIEDVDTHGHHVSFVMLHEVLDEMVLVCEDHDRVLTDVTSELSNRIAEALVDTEEASAALASPDTVLAPDIQLPITLDGEPAELPDAEAMDT